MGLSDVITCRLCGHGEESVEHLRDSCQAAEIPSFRLTRHTDVVDGVLDFLSEPRIRRLFKIAE